MINTKPNTTYTVTLHYHFLPCMKDHLQYDKGQAIPVQARTGPKGSRRFRHPDFQTISTQRWYGCQSYAPAAFIPQEVILALISFGCAVDHSAAERIKSMQKTQ